MLKGWSNPLSPKGNAALVGSLPHHVSLDGIQVNFKAGEDVARRYLPEGVEPIKEGLGFALVADMMKVSADNLSQPYNNPEATQYGEGLVGFYGKYKGMTGKYNAFIWVDKDWSTVFGHLMGFPKKIGHISKTRIHPFNNGMKQIGEGTNLRGIVSRESKRILDIGIEIEKKEDDNSFPTYGADQVFLLRYLPSIGKDIPSVKQLCSMELEDFKTLDVWSGIPHLSFGESDNEELAEIGEIELLNAFSFKQAWTIPENKVKLLTEL